MNLNLAKSRKSNRRRFRVGRRHKGIQDFLILIIIPLFLLIPAFHNCHEMMDSDIFSSPRHFEKAHPAQMAPNRQETWQGLESNAHVLILLLTAIFFKQFFHPLPPFFSVDQRGSLLRC